MSTERDPDPGLGLDPGSEWRPPAAAAVATRLQWLFRHTLRQGQPHPLLTLLMQYREVAP
jgi:hypothetical protein